MKTTLQSRGNACAHAVFLWMTSCSKPWLRWHSNFNPAESLLATTSLFCLVRQRLRCSVRDQGSVLQGLVGEVCPRASFKVPSVSFGLCEPLGFGPLCCVGALESFCFGLRVVSVCLPPSSLSVQRFVFPFLLEAFGV